MPRIESFVGGDADATAKCSGAVLGAEDTKIHEACYESLVSTRKTPFLSR
jgi:hypothetical protein